MPRTHMPHYCRPLLLAAVSLSLPSLACENFGAGNQKRMFYASGAFKQGHDDGLRDAEWALMDASGAWMWYWAKDEEYRRGYDQGWNDGRNKKKLLAQQDEHRRMSQRRSQEVPESGDTAPSQPERETPQDERGN